MSTGWFGLLTFLVLAISVYALPQEEGQQLSFFEEIFRIIQAALDIILEPLFGSRRGALEDKDQAAGRVSYTRYQLIRVRARSLDELVDLESLQDEPGVQFWTPAVRNQSTDVLIPPELTEYAKQLFVERGIEFSVVSPNIEQMMHSQNPKAITNDRYVEMKSTRGHSMTWNRYHRYDDMLEYMEHLGNTAPHLVELFTIGKSSLGRPLKVVKISSGSSRTPRDGKASYKQAIWIDGGVHGREWISPAVAMYMLKQLVENYESNRKVVDGIDWYIMPVMNPDGYEYTHTTDRFWRKTRSADSEARSARFLWGGGEECRGVDLNRNWDFHWGEAGASEEPCHETFAGRTAMSEPETRAVANFIMEHRERLRAYLTLHSYSQMWLVPWGYTRVRATDYDDMVYMGRRAVEALQRVYGTQYQLGSSPALLYPTAGSSDDWAKGKARIKYSYTVELRDKGNYGFLLPASQITPTGRETFAAVRTIARAIINKLD